MPSRRSAIKGLAVLAAASGFRIGWGQSVVAPLGNSEQLADLGLRLSAEQRAAGTSFLERYPSVDTHSHPGRFFLKDLASLAHGHPVSALPALLSTSMPSCGWWTQWE